MASNDVAVESNPHQDTVVTGFAESIDEQPKCAVLAPMATQEVNSNIEYSKHTGSDDYNETRVAQNGFVNSEHDTEESHSQDSVSSDQDQPQSNIVTIEEPQNQGQVFNALNGSALPLKLEGTSSDLIGDLSSTDQQEDVQIQNAVTLSQTQVTDLLTQALQESAIPSDFHLFLVQQPDGETTIIQGQPLILQQLVLPQSSDGSSPTLAGQLILASPQLLQLDPSALSQVQTEQTRVFAEQISENPALQMVQNASQEGHTCTTCGKTLKLRRSLNRHMRDVHGKEKTERPPPVRKDPAPKPQLMPIAGIPGDPLQQHQQTQKVGKTYTCNRCGITVKSSWSLTRHTRNVHGEGKIACMNQGCPELFTAKQAMLRHYEECKERIFATEIDPAYQNSDMEVAYHDTASQDAASAEEENNMSDSNFEETNEVSELKPVVEGDARKYFQL